MLRNASLFLVMAVLLSSHISWAEDVHSILVVVNGEPITKYDLDEQLNIVRANFRLKLGDRFDPVQAEQAINEQRQGIIEKMVEEILLEEEVTRLQLRVDPAQIDAYFDRLREMDEFKDDEASAATLANMGLTMEAFRAKVEKDMLKQQLIQGIVGTKLVVTETEIDEAFASKPEAAGGLRQHLKAIMVPTEEEMDTVVAAIDGGKMTFEEAAKAYSAGPAPEEGGDLGLIVETDMSEAWKAALSDLESGEVSEPFHVDGTYVLLKFEESSSLRVNDAPGMRDKIFQEIRERKLNEQYDGYMKRLRETAVIEWK
ncbi:MAG: SurA N-terminal domain-containing protein [Proteobacteria bacterium]|nr:SurA N-terminal domain-containing protein [Pseudomonadota bacterium]